MSEKKFVKVGQLKKGGYVLIDDEVCKISDVTTSKPGKHGSAKARITGIGVFRDVKKTLLQPTSADAEIPIIDKVNAQVIADLGERIQLMNLESYETFEVPKPADIQGLEAGKEVELIKWGANVMVSRVKS